MFPLREIHYQPIVEDVMVDLIEQLFVFGEFIITMETWYSQILILPVVSKVAVQIFLLQEIPYQQIVEDVMAASIIQAF